MSQNELESMNLRELRQLASEHHVNNRSRLAKQDLIQALANVVGQGASQKKAVPEKSTTANKKTSTSKKSSATTKAPAKKAASRKTSTKAEKTVQQEPEVLDAAAVAGLQAVAQPKTSKPPVSTSNTQKQAAEAAKAPARSEKNNGKDTEQKNATDANAVGTTDAKASAPETEESRPRGRNRRRRGSRNNNDENRSGNGRNETAGKTTSEATRPTNVTPSTTTTTPTISDTKTPPATDENPQAGRQTQRNQRSRQTQQAQQTQQSQQRAPRVPKPRLENNQRSTPPILNRLKDFACGILELCDPETPSWAQARLSELLAESGVYPTPCKGQPHPDFHEIVGSIKSEQVEDGHIALIESPGFSLRGDRGDLFALRKAKVRVAGDAYKEKPAEAAPTPNDSKAAPATATSEKNVQAASATQTSQAKTSAPPPTPSTSSTAQAAPTTSTAKASTEAKSTPSAPRTPSTPDTKKIESAEKPTRSRRSRSARSRSQSDAASTENVGGDSDKESAHESEPLLDDVQKKSRPPRKVNRASTAEALPLKAQSADELKERGLSTGFAPLGLQQQILADLHSMGFENPSPIQEQCIPVAIDNKDIIGQAQTGTGKTAAFVLPILHKLYEWDGVGPVALICCPTRELAKQVYNEFTKMAGQSAARAALIYGGVSMNDQFTALERKPHVIIGTPGRLIDHVKRHTLDLSHLKMLVLDEADQMLDIGFLPDIEFLFKHSPPKRQCMLFSATMAPEIKRLCEKYQNDPQHIHIAPEAATVSTVDQKFIAVDRPKKNDLLAHFIETHNPEQLVVFCKTKAQTDRVAQVLRRKKMKASAIHGDLPQNKRERTLQEFRNGTLHCLIATNVAARGLDIPAISHVVNYDIPENPDEYVHRIGRTGRMGASGVARTFITADDGQFLVEIEKLIGFELEEEHIEGFKATTEKKIARSIADTPSNAPRILKPLVGGIRLGRRRR